jgi:hypothetical protein
MREGRIRMKSYSLLIFLGMALCLSCSSCSNQNRYDITGTWHFYEYREPDHYLDFTYTFVGTEKQGQLDLGSMGGLSGEYIVDVDQIFFRVTATKGIWIIREYTGVFITNDLMKGTLNGKQGEAGRVTLTWSGVWNARRIEGRAHRAIF